jgi:hypothetical protein
MVCHHYSGLVPKNTTEQAPFWEKLKIGKGKIVQWICYQPEECANLVKFWVVYHGTQIFPFNPEEWAYGFFIPTAIPDQIVLTDEPFTLDFYAINLDDSYDHEYHVYVSIDPAQPVAMPGAAESSLYTRLKSYFGEL